MTSIADLALVHALRAPAETRSLRVDEALAALADADPGWITALDEPSRRAFWIHVYNVLTQHGMQGRAGNVSVAWHRTAWVPYVVAGLRLTLDQIEHGLLRDDARPPLRLFRSLGKRHPAWAWRVPLDPRIHFALNCGAVSCPPVRVYAAETLDADLERAQTAFLAAESTVDDVRRRVTTNQLAQFYARDLGGRGGILARIENALGRPAGALSTYALRYRPYDWSAATRFAP